MPGSRGNSLACMYDLIIHGGKVVDGTGGPIARADVAVRDGRIVAVEPAIDPSEAAHTIDAAGCIVTPGFVDPHPLRRSGHLG